MQTPAIPVNETTRLETLKSLDILDSSPQERFDRITRMAKRMFGVSNALITLIDSDRQWFLSTLETGARETTRDVSFCGHAILGDEILTVPDALQDARFDDNPFVINAPFVRFYAGCPISFRNGSKLGTLCLIDPIPRQFSEEDKALLTDLARMVEQEILALQLATIDELTMISNRRGFELLSKRALSLCDRTGCTACLLFFDLDKFKQINDQFGHAEGDRALQEFSRILMDTFRESDVIGRIGGDEFAVLQTKSTGLDAQKSLQRLESNISAYNARATKNYDIEFSVGFVEYDFQKHRTIQSMLADADHLMYKQKKSVKSLRF